MEALVLAVKLYQTSFVLLDHSCYRYSGRGISPTNGQHMRLVTVPVHRSMSSISHTRILSSQEGSHLTALGYRYCATVRTLNNALRSRVAVT